MSGSLIDSILAVSSAGECGQDNSVGIATYKGAGRSGDRIPMGATFPAPIQTGLGAQPASYTMGNWSFPDVKRPGRGVDHPPPSSAEVRESRAILLLPTWAFAAGYRVNCKGGPAGCVNSTRQT